MASPRCCLATTSLFLILLLVWAITYTDSLVRTFKLSVNYVNEISNGNEIIAASERASSNDYDADFQIDDQDEDFDQGQLVSTESPEKSKTEEPSASPSAKRGNDEEIPISELSGAEKIKRFPECSSSRRVEHPGIGGGPRVQYIHNPKAGGTSIQIATWKWTLEVPGASFMKYDQNSVHGSSLKCPTAAFDHTFLAGHRGYGFCENIENSPRGLFTFTAFRDPVSCVVSWYDYFLFKLHEARAVSVFGSKNMELSDIIKKYDKTPEIEYGEQLLRYAGQQQARYMCGYACMGPLARGNKNYTEAFILGKAVDNLRKLDVVGITEELDKMVAQLKFHLPQLVPENFTGFKRDNSMGRKSILDEDAKRILREWAWVDQRLYQEAKRIYAEKQEIAERCLNLFGESIPTRAPSDISPGRSESARDAVEEITEIESKSAASEHQRNEDDKSEERAFLRTNDLGA